MRRNRDGVYRGLCKTTPKIISTRKNVQGKKSDSEKDLSAWNDPEESGAYCLNFSILLLNVMEGYKHAQYRPAYVSRMGGGRHP